MRTAAPSRMHPLKSGSRTKTDFTICRNRTRARWSFADASSAMRRASITSAQLSRAGIRFPWMGPVGDMVRAQGRHGWRPAHIHFLVGAPGYSEGITALYMADDEHIDSDTVFGANESLITEPKPNGSGSPFGPLPSIHFDFTLAAAKIRRRLRSRDVSAPIHPSS
jgi:hypothetical protein